MKQYTTKQLDWWASSDVFYNSFEQDVSYED